MRRRNRLALLTAVLVVAVVSTYGCARVRTAPDLGRGVSETATQLTVGPVAATTGLVDCDALPAAGAVLQSWHALQFQCLADGKVVRGSQLRGRATVAIVWASWCGPCREELPYLADFATSQQQVRVIGIGWKDQPRALQAYARQSRLPFPTIVDPDAAIGSALGINSQPSLLLIDADGVVVHVHRTPISSVAELSALAREYL